MAYHQTLVVGLFAVFVFVVATTFTAYFMRALIPWRAEYPRFSDAIAYVLSTLLGLMTATYAISGATTVSDADKIASVLYQACVMLAASGAVAVVAYVIDLEIQERR